MSNRFHQLRSSGRAALAQLRRAVRDRAHVGLAPADRRVDDTFLVEFPKSGVTWLSFLLAKVNLQMSGIDRNPTHFAINDLVPDIHQSNHLGNGLPFPGHRIIKSHAPHNPLYAKVFYLVRDPRDVMASYHAMLTILGQYQGDLASMVDSPDLGIAAWCDHVEGWLTRTRPGVSFNVIRYEDLQEDTEGVLRHIYRVLGYTIPDGVLKTAVDTASFQAMKDDEALCSARNLALPKGFTFVRKGGRSHEGDMAPDLARRIVDRAGPLMRRLGYDVQAT